MRFYRCLETHSICGPSRATILTVTNNHINSFVDNTNRVFNGSQITSLKLLKMSGYQTAIVGQSRIPKNAVDEKVSGVKGAVYKNGYTEINRT